MKHFLIVSFVLGFRLLFAQDYIQKDSALTMGTVVVIDDQSLYFKKFKRDRYVRLGVNEVVEYRQNGKVFRASNFQGNRRFYRVAGKSDEATILMVPKGFLLQSAGANNFVGSRKELISKLRTTLNAPQRNVPNRSFFVPRALNYNLTKIIDKDYQSLLFPRWSLTGGVMVVDQQMNYGAISTQSDRWSGTNTASFFGVRYQKPFFKPNGLFFELQTSIVSMNSELSGSFTKVKINSTHVILPIGIVWEKRINRIAPYLKGGFVFSYSSYTSTEKIPVLNSLVQLSNSGISFGAHGGIGVSAIVKNQVRIFIEGSGQSFAKSSFGDFGISTSLYSISGGITL